MTHIVSGSLNAPGFASEVVRELHLAFPELTFDCTAKDVPVNEYGLIYFDQPVICGPDSKPGTDSYPSMRASSGFATRIRPSGVLW